MNLTLEQVDLGVRITAVVIAVAWALVLFDRKRWWPLQWSLHLDAAAREPHVGEHSDVVVVIPARNEAATLPQTLPRFLKQADWVRRIVVVDDRSVDRTSSCARRLAAGTPAEDRLHVVRIDDTEPEWSGKVYAMQRGYETAVEGWDGDPTRQWILFTDADVLHPTCSLSRLMAKAGTGEFDLISVMVRLRARTAWEWLLIPGFTYFFQLLFPFRKVSARSYRGAAAASEVMLIRRSALDEAGDLESIRDRTADGVALAEAVKRSGGNCWLGLDPDFASLRTYDAYGPVHEKVARSAFEILGQHHWKITLVVLTLLLLYVGPPLLALYGAVRFDLIIGGAALIAWLVSMVTYLPVVQYLGVPSGLAAMLPLTGFLYAVMVAASGWRQLLGRRAEWRTSTEVDLTE